ATHAFEFDADTQSIQDVVAAINASDLELEAVYEADIDRFFLKSRETGAAVSVTFDDDPDQFLRNTLQLRDRGDDPIMIGTAYEGQDARFDYDGAKGITRSSNVFAINGVTYSLHKAAPGETVTVRVTQDVDAAVNA